MRRTYQYQLKPTNKQSIALQDLLDSQRNLYNWALAQRKDSWTENQEQLRLYDQQAMLPEMKKTEEWESLRRFPAGVSQDTLKRLDLSFQAFFRRIKSGETPGYPRFRGHGWFNTVRLDLGKGGVIWDTWHTGRKVPSSRSLDIHLRTTTVYIQGIGHLKVNKHRPISGTPKVIDVSRRTRGRWTVSVSCDNVDATDGFTPTDNEIGIDLGINEFVSTSDGELVANPRFMKTQADKVASAQQGISRKKMGSHRRRKAKVEISILKEKEQLQRKDFHRKVAKSLVSSANVIYAEDLNVKQMIEGEGNFGKRQKTGLNRSMSDAGWGQFISYLTVKAESAGRHVILVNPAYTSQTCRGCGHTSRDNRNGISFKCAECDFSGHADILAAMNIRDRGQGLTSPDGPCIPLNLLSV